MKLSVIIPVHCAETTLDRCVESVVMQHIEEMEIILVDDGSPDNCPQLCDEWARKSPLIKVIHQPNRGLSGARNAGIREATSTYITFVDADDLLSPDTYAPLLDMMGGHDMLEYSVLDRLTLEDHIYTDLHEYWLKARAYTHSYVCNKIYLRTLFDEIRFPEGKIFEDVQTMPLLLRKARSIVTTHRGYYHYTWNPQGITATADGQGLAQLLEAHLTSGMPMDDSYYMYLVNIQMDVWERTGAPLALPSRRIDTTVLTGRKKAKAAIINLFGMKTLCRISKTIHLFRKPSRL